MEFYGEDGLRNGAYVGRIPFDGAFPVAASKFDLSVYNEIQGTDDASSGLGNARPPRSVRSAEVEVGQGAKYRAGKGGHARTPHLSAWGVSVLARVLLLKAWVTFPSDCCQYSQTLDIRRCPKYSSFSSICRRMPGYSCY